MGAKVLKWTPDRRDAVEAALRSSTTRLEAATKLGVTDPSLNHALKTYDISAHELLGQDKRGEVVIAAPSSPDLPIGELLAQRKRRYDLKEAHAESSKEIPVRIKGDKPVGVLLFGDPHLDDDGCDLALLEAHARLVRETDGLYAGTVGDMTNNWVGRLAHLWAQQGTTACDAWRLCEWMISEVRDWLFLVGGNHDAWSGNGDPLKWITAQQSALYQSSEVRMGLRFGTGGKFIINARHDFKGHSMWNPVHGLSKSIQMGLRDDLSVAGHLHISGYAVHKDPTSGKACHAIRVATYKRFDRFALDHNMRDQNLSPCALIVVDPRLPDTHPDRMKHWWDPQEGADYLGWARKRSRAPS
jgi:hypothetical protein